jgi:transcription-repair coupling factor (superfamily II helicase)
LDLPESINNFIARLAPEEKRIYNLTGSSAALFLSLVDGHFIMKEPSDEQASRLYNDILFYRSALGLDSSDVCFLPSPNGPETAGNRAEVSFGLLSSSRKCSVVLSEGAAEAALWQPEVLEKQILRLEKGVELRRELAEENLIGLGYTRVPLVAEAGQYSLRGWILDIFPQSGGPYRVEFFGDEIESIREFDIETQRSIEGVQGISVMPVREPEDGVVIDGLLGEVKRFYAESKYVEPLKDGTALSSFAIKGEGTDAGLLSLGGTGITPDERKDIYGLSGSVDLLSREHRVVVVASSGGQAERLKDVFEEGGLDSPVIDVQEAMSYDGRISIVVGELSSGLFLPGLLVLTEEEIFGGRPAYKPMRKSKASGLLEKVEDLQQGDMVVHNERGIGRFRGLVHQSVEGHEYDLLSIEYLEGDKLYLPVDSIGKVRKYHAKEGVVPSLDSLRTKKWQKTRERIRKRIRDMAEKLLKVYAKREVAEGFLFSTDTELHREFDSFFLYEETPDQITAVNEIKSDMESQRPMERLLSGDVGYGKTEVAMRAAFKSVYDGKQVAVLVPTTLLCEQHLRIFKKRFSAFPVNIEGLSRFRTPAERKRTIDKLKTGDVDIVIATHALLKPRVIFYNLGLLIIDEEHRFGVKQKERIRELKHGVDVLSMSATPIPRTLQMSLSGIRSMSVIETPPEERLSVKTTVSVYDESLINEVIARELRRDGQVFFVHNRIQDIDKIRKMLERVAPYARVAVAHGQMPERELEKIMLMFLDMKVDVLLSTAIVGSGLDIPSANTIIIDMAHKMGLADLYQLRGRVGRSSVRGYAYYLIPRGEVITEDAQKRLQALQELSYMGAGFRLAMKDLEIRGAGNLLGTQQSGYIEAVGLEMYVEMLEQAVADLKGLDIKKEVRPEIDLRLNAYIPDDYIEDMALRLSVYRKLSIARTDMDLRDIEDEMGDRFGPPPGAFKNLIKTMQLSLLASKLHLKGIKQHHKNVVYTIGEGSNLTAKDIMDAFDEKARFHPDGFELPTQDNVYDEVKKALEILLNH